jgi:hypothetical protein
MSILDYKIHRAIKKAKLSGEKIKISTLESELMKIRISRKDIPSIIKTYAKNLRINWNNR